MLGDFGESKTMERTSERLERLLGRGREPDPEIVLRVLRKFIQTGALSGYRDIRNVCLGLMRPIEGKKSVATSLDSTKLLLRNVDRYQSEPKKLKRCFQALLSAYLALDGYDQKSESHPQWLALKQRLITWLPTLQVLKPHPEWLGTALENRNLLSDDPTKRYGTKVLRGEHAEFESVCEKLSIDRHSWVRRRVIISSVELAIKEGDDKFKSYLDRLIELLMENPGVRDEGAMKLLDRYAQLVSRPEHTLLRILAIEAFGSPLVTANKSRWFNVSQQAREMVENWLKGYLIERFFELLSHDGHTDKRRPKFWLRHRGSIETMWFILGASAMSSWNEDFRKLRDTMGNQCLSLEGATVSNNAFVMKIGKIYVVEFGEKGNATFLFGQSALPFNLSGKYLGLSKLKSANHLERLLHMDRRDSWEDRFSDALAKYGVYPDEESPSRREPTRSTSARVPLGGVFTPSNFLQVFKQFCNECGLQYEDRIVGGRLIVYADSSNSFISGKLGQWGFTYESGHRRWVKDA